MEEQVANQETTINEKYSFHKIWTLLPPPLMAETIKRMAAAILLLVASLIMLALSKEIMWLGGVLLALMPAYLALSIVWQFGAGKLIVARMIIIKSQKSRHSQLSLLCRPATDADIISDEIETYRIRLSPQLRDKGHFTKGTVLEMYFTETSPNIALAYRILGEK